MLSNEVKSKRSGFTLIELLVVIAIIAILAAILFPVFAKAREKARQTSCLSQTKQLGLSLMQYNQDYDEKLPSGTQGAAKPGQGWAGQIYNQVKSTAIFKCPDDSQTATSPAVPVSYAYNSNIVGQPQSVFQNVARTVLMFEATGVATDVAGVTAGVFNDTSSAAGNGTQSGATYGPATTRYTTGYLANSAGSGTTKFSAANGLHSDGSNFLLADGHSKWFRGSAVTAGANNATANSCGATDVAANTGCATSTIAATFGYD